MRKDPLFILITVITFILIGIVVYSYLFNSNNKITENKLVQTDQSKAGQIDFRRYSNEEGFTFEYPTNWRVVEGESMKEEIISRLDILEENPAGTTVQDFQQSSIAIILTNQSTQNLENLLKNENDAKSEGNKIFGSHSGTLYTGTNLQTSHTPEVKNSQLEFITTIDGHTFWFRLFTLPEKIGKDQKIFNHLISTFRYIN